MIEYVTMIRGANLVAGLIPDKANSQFGKLSPESHIRALTEMVTEQPKDGELIEEVISSVDALGVLCLGSHEVKYWTSLKKASEVLRTSSLDGKHLPPLLSRSLMTRLRVGAIANIVQHGKSL